MISFAPLLLGAILAAVDAPVEPDTIIRGATICDGTGAMSIVGDLAIKGDRIVGIGKFPIVGKPRVIEGKGLIVAPGFIDLHTHSDEPLTQPKTGANLCYLYQGVTTVVTGNCGMGPYDVAAYFQKLENNTIGSNVIHQVPHNDVRRQVMKNANRPPTDEELKKMELLVDKGMRDGAWGLSTGLIYNPGTYAGTDEIIALAKVAARHGGFYASHIRNEATEVLAATAEAIRIGREAKLPVHISHMKVYNPKAWGKSSDTIALVEKARKEGQIVTADQYPYTASSTSLAAMVVPSKYRDGSREEYLKRFDDPEEGLKIRQAIAASLELRNNGESLRIARYTPKKSWQGKSLKEISRLEKRPVLDIVVEIEKKGGAAAVSFGMHEDDVRLIMKQTFVTTASDGSSQDIDSDSVPHPRSYGCFARKIGHYAIVEKTIPVEHAIRSASGLPADILKLPERGYLKAGYLADVVVFDPETYRDKATYDKPHQYATGVKYVFVNGKLAIEDGKYTEVRAGKVLRHKSAREN